MGERGWFERAAIEDGRAPMCSEQASAELLAHPEAFKKLGHATAEDLVKDLTSPEDPDSLLLLGATLGGGFVIMSYDGDRSAQGGTITEALAAFKALRR